MPKRLLKPTLRQSERWNSLPLFAQNLFIRLIMVVDDDGRVEAGPNNRLVRSECFPLGDQHGNDIPLDALQEAVDQLQAARMLLSYRTATGRQVIALARWTERRRTPSRLPAPPSGLLDEPDVIEGDFRDDCEQLSACCAQMPAGGEQMPAGGEQMLSSTYTPVPPRTSHVLPTYTPVPPAQSALVLGDASEPAVQPTATPAAQETRQRRQRASEPVTIPDALNTPEFNAAWETWLAHRRSAHRTPTPQAMRLQLNRLSSIGPQRAIAAIEHSVANGWTGIFEVQHENNRNTGRNQSRNTGTANIGRSGDYASAASR